MDYRERLDKLIADRLRGGQPVESVPNAVPNKAPKVVDPQITTGRPDTPVTNPPAPSDPNKKFYLLHEKVPEGVETQIGIVKDEKGRDRKVRLVKGANATAEPTPEQKQVFDTVNKALTLADQTFNQLEMETFSDIDWSKTGEQFGVSQALMEKGELASKEANTGSLTKEEQDRYDYLSNYIEKNQINYSTRLASTIFDPISEDGVLGGFEAIHNLAKGISGVFLQYGSQFLATGAASAGAGFSAGAVSGPAAPLASSIAALTAAFTVGTKLHNESRLAEQKDIDDQFERDNPGEKGPGFDRLRAISAGAVNAAFDTLGLKLIGKIPGVGKFVDYILPGGSSGEIVQKATDETKKTLLKRATENMTLISAISLAEAGLEGAQEYVDFYGGDVNSTVIGTLTSPEAAQNALSAFLWGFLSTGTIGGLGASYQGISNYRKNRAQNKPLLNTPSLETSNELNANSEDLYGEFVGGETNVAPVTETIEDLLVKGSKKKDTVKNFENIYKDAKSDVNRLDTKGVKIFNLKDKQALYNNPEFFDSIFTDLDKRPRKEVPDTDSKFGNSPFITNDGELIVFDERVDDIFNSVLSTNERFRTISEKDPSVKLTLFKEVTNGIKESRRKAEAAIEAVKNPESPIRLKLLEAYESSKANPVRRRLITDLAATLPMIEKNPLVGHLMSDQTLLDLKAAIDSGKYKEREIQNKRQRLDQLALAIGEAGTDQKRLSEALKGYVDENYRPSNPLKVFDEIADVAVMAATTPPKPSPTVDPVTGLPSNTMEQLITERLLESNEYLKEVAGEAGVDYIRNKIISNLNYVKTVDPKFKGTNIEAWFNGQQQDVDNSESIFKDTNLNQASDGTVKPVVFSDPTARPRVDTKGLGKFYTVFPEDGVDVDLIEASDDYGRFENANKEQDIKEIELDDKTEPLNLDEPVTDSIEFINEWPGDKPSFQDLNRLAKIRAQADANNETLTAKDLLDFLVTLSPRNKQVFDELSKNGVTFTDKATGEKKFVFSPNKFKNQFKNSVFPVDIKTASSLRNLQNVINKAGQLYPGASSVFDTPEVRVTEKFDPSKDITYPTKSKDSFFVTNVPGRTIFTKFKSPQVEFIAKQSLPMFNSFIRAMLGKQGFNRTNVMNVADMSSGAGVYYHNYGLLINSFTYLQETIDVLKKPLTWQDFRKGVLTTFFHEAFHAADFQNIIPKKDREIILRDRDKIIDWGNKNGVWGDYKRIGMSLGPLQTDIELPAYVFMEYAIQRIEKGLIKNGKLALDSNAPFQLEDFWNEIDKAWKAGGTSPVANIPSPTLRKVFEAIFEGIVQFRKWLTGQGVNSWNDVFDNLISGEYGRRADKAKIVFTNFPDALKKPSVTGVNPKAGISSVPEDIEVARIPREAFVSQVIENDIIKQSEQTTFDSTIRKGHLEALDKLVSRLENSDIKKSLEQFSTRMKRLLRNIDGATVDLTDKDAQTWLLGNLASAAYIPERGVSLEMVARRDEDAAKVLEFSKSMENLPRQILHALNPIASQLKQQTWFPKTFNIALDLRKRNVSLKDINPDGTLTFKDGTGKQITLPRSEVEKLKTVTTAFSVPLTMYSELAWRALNIFKGQHPELVNVIQNKNVTELKQVVSDLIRTNKENPDNTRLTIAELKTLRDITNQIVEFDKYVLGGKIYVPEMRFGNRAIAVYSTRPADRDAYVNDTDPDLRMDDDAPPKKVLVGLFMSEPDGAFERELNPTRMKEREQKLRNDILKKYNVKDGYEVTQAFDMTNDALGRTLKANDVDLSIVASMMANKLSGLYGGEIDANPAELKQTIQNHITVQGFGKHLIKSRHIDGASTDANRVIDQFYNSASYGVSRAAHGPLLTKVAADLKEKENTEPDQKGKYKTLRYHLDYSTSTDGDFAKIRTFGFLMALGGNLSSAVLQLHSNVVMGPMNLARHGIMNPLSGLQSIKPALLYFTRAAAEDYKSMVEGIKGFHKKGYFELDDPAFLDRTLDPFLKLVVKDPKEREYIKKSIQDNSISVSPSIVDEGRTNITTRNATARYWDRIKQALGYMMQRSEQSGRTALYITTLRALYNNPVKLATVLADLNENPKFREMRVFNRSLDDLNAIASFITGESFAYSNKVSRPGYNRGFLSIATSFSSMPGQMFETWLDVVIGQGRGKLNNKVMASAYAVLMTAALAGAAGFPAYELLISLIEKFADRDAPGELQLKKFIGDLTGSPMIGELMTRGAIRPLTGIDIAQRVAVEPGYQDLAMLAVGAILGQEPKLRDIGILGSTTNTGIALVQQIQNGGLDSEKTALAFEQALPAALRNASASARYLGAMSTDGVIKNAKGTPILPASDLEVSDIFAKFFGFQPTEIYNANIMTFGKNLSARTNEQAKTNILDEIAAIDRRKERGLSYDNTKREALVQEYYRLSNGRSKEAMRSLSRGIKTRLLASRNPVDPKVTTPGQEQFLSTFKDYIKISE